MATKDMIYEGLGFSVLLKGVEIYVSRGEELPKINHNYSHWVRIPIRIKESETSSSP